MRTWLVDEGNRRQISGIISRVGAAKSVRKVEDTGDEKGRWVCHRAVSAARHSNGTVFEHFNCSENTVGIHCHTWSGAYIDLLKSPGDINPNRISCVLRETLQPEGFYQKVRNRQP